MLGYVITIVQTNTNSDNTDNGPRHQAVSTRQLHILQ